MSEFLTIEELARLIPRESPATYRLDGSYTLYDIDGGLRYRICQARLLDCSAHQTYGRVVGVVVRHRAGRFVIMTGSRPVGALEGMWFIDTQGERFRLLEVPVGAQN